MGTKIAALITINDNHLSQQALYLAYKQQSGKLLNLADVYLIAIVNQEQAFLAHVDDYFSKVKTELLHTAASFLLNNMSGINTAKQLHIHRNTLLYRLNSFQQLTKINLHDFDDASFFRFWWFSHQGNQLCTMHKTHYAT